MGYMTKSRYYKHHVKPVLNKILIITSIIIILITSFTLIINSIKKEFKKCDNASNHICTLYELKNYNK